jgi:5-methylcytosine-specific restriction endonuclease McrA
MGQALQHILGMSCRKARRELAALYPQSLRGFHDRIRPINEEFSEVRFAAPWELLDKLEEIKGLLAHSHSHPGIGLAQLIDVLASEYRERHHPEAKARRAREREEAHVRRSETEDDEIPERQLRIEQSPSAPRVVRNVEDRRRPSASLLRALIQRDGYQCAHVDEKTRKRCGSRYGLEADHHPVPWSHGGKTELSNLRLICVGHHARATFLEFGTAWRRCRLQFALR